MLNALAVAQSLIGSGQAQTILVATRMFTAARSLPAGSPANLADYSATAPAPLFFRSAAGIGSSEGYRLGDFLFGCAGQYAAAVQVSGEKNGGLAVQFDVKRFLGQRSPAWKKF